MQRDVRVECEKRLHLLRLAGGQVVEDHVQVAAARLARDKRGQEAHTLGARVAHRRVAEHFAGTRIEGRVEREGTVTVILEAVALGAAGRQRQDGVESIEGLDGGLLIEAEDRCVLRRLQIQADDIGRFLLEVGVARAHVAL